MATIDVTHPAREVRNQALALQPVDLFEIDAPSATSPSCARTTGMATESTRSSSTRHGTGCCGARSSARSTASRGASLGRARTWFARRCSRCGETPTMG